MNLFKVENNDIFDRQYFPINAKITFLSPTVALMVLEGALVICRRIAHSPFEFDASTTLTISPSKTKVS